MSRRRMGVEKFPWLWAAIVIVLMVACAALGVGWYSANRASSTATCVNDILGARAAPTARDNAAHIAFAQAIDALFEAPRSEQAKAAAQLQDEVRAYVSVLVADQKERDLHPLGRC